MIKEASLQDLQMMFLETLVRYKDEPVYIEGIFKARLKDSYTVELYSLLENDYFTVEFNEVDFNFKPVRLGYINHRGFAVYIYRQPYRKFKQGLHRDCIVTLQPELMDYGVGCMDRYIRVSDQVHSLQKASLRNTIKGIYPTLKDAIIKINGGAFEVAFDRQFSIDKWMNIRYKSKIVGRYFDGKIQFNKGFEYLLKAIRKNYEA